MLLSPKETVTTLLFAFYKISAFEPSVDLGKFVFAIVSMKAPRENRPAGIIIHLQRDGVLGTNTPPRNHRTDAGHRAIDGALHARAVSSG